MRGLSGGELRAGGGEAGERHVGGGEDAGREAGEGERGGIGAGGARGADQHHLAAEPVGPGGGEFGADQQAGEPGAGAFGREVGDQRLGAQAEEAGGHAFGARQRVLDGLGEIGIRPALGGDGMAQDGLAGEEREELAGHEGGEGDDLAGAEMRPFRMGAGQAGDAVEAGLAREQPGDLGLLAAHHVGGAVLPEPVQDMDAQAGVAGRGAGEGRVAARRGGHGGIGRLDPALARADHAAGDHVDGFGAEPGADQVDERGLEAVAVERAHAAVGFGPGKRRSVRTHRPGAQVRGAPVDRDPVGTDRGVGHPVTTTPPSTTMAWPVIMREAFEARKSVASTMSRSTRCSFRHWRSRWAASASGVAHLSSWRSVSTQPGISAFTRMRSGPSSRARPRVSPVIAALADM
jgi:hypothetical protein